MPCGAVTLSRRPSKRACNAPCTSPCACARVHARVHVCVWIHVCCNSCVRRLSRRESKLQTASMHQLSFCPAAHLPFSPLMHTVARPRYPSNSMNTAPLLEPAPDTPPPKTASMISPVSWLWGRIRANDKLHIAYCAAGVVGCLMVYGVLQASGGGAHDRSKTPAAAAACWPPFKHSEGDGRPNVGVNSHSDIPWLGRRAPIGSLSPISRLSDI